MKFLKILLWIVGIFYVLAVPFIFIPWTIWGTIFAWFNLSAPPNLPIVTYLFKTSLTVFATLGIFYITLALNPIKYGKMLYLAAFSLLFMGTVCLLTGLTHNLPRMMYTGDSIFCLLFGTLIGIQSYIVLRK